MSRSSRWTRESGQSLVEIAVSVPILLVMLLGGAEMARVGYAAIEVTNAAKAAVQYGAESQATALDETGMQTAAQDEVTDVPVLSNITLSSVSWSATCSDGTTPTDGAPQTTNPPVFSSNDCTNAHLIESVSVTVGATFTPDIKLNSFFNVLSIPTSFNLSGSATQVILQH